MIWETWQVWVATGMALMVLEVFVPGFVLACLGLGSFGGALAAYFDFGFAWQMTASASTALLAFVFLRPIAIRWGFRGDESVSGGDALPGQECVVTQSFDGTTGLGRCKIDGDDWRAKLTDKAEAAIAIEGSIVRIARVESNTLIVSVSNNISSENPD